MGARLRDAYWAFFAFLNRPCITLGFAVEGHAQQPPRRQRVVVSRLRNTKGRFMRHPQPVEVAPE